MYTLVATALGSVLLGWVAEKTLQRFSWYGRLRRFVTKHAYKSVLISVYLVVFAAVFDAPLALKGGAGLVLLMSCATAFSERIKGYRLDRISH